MYLWNLGTRISGCYKTPTDFWILLRQRWVWSRRIVKVFTSALSHHGECKVQSKIYVIAKQITSVVCISTSGRNFSMFSTIDGKRIDKIWFASIELVQKEQFENIYEQLDVF